MLFREKICKLFAPIDFNNSSCPSSIEANPLTELTNTGKLINPEDIFIFKDYDLLEGGIDWNFMNSKRREMLTVRNDIYNYIGAYRSLINAINFFKKMGKMTKIIRILYS
jgi:hypothetical protein